MSQGTYVNKVSKLIAGRRASLRPAVGNRQKSAQASSAAASSCPSSTTPASCDARIQSPSAAVAAA